MATLTVFESTSLDGYFTDKDGDNSWAHSSDPEWLRFVAGNASGSEGMLLFGRRTYEQMVAFWPTPQAAQAMPTVAAAMNARPKLVFSRTLQGSDWHNTRVAADAVAEVRRLRAGDGPDMVVLGSGEIVAQLAGAGLVDRYQIVVMPLVLGAGRTLFDGVGRRLALLGSRSFGNGNLVLDYAPA